MGTKWRALPVMAGVVSCAVALPACAALAEVGSGAPSKSEQSSSVVPSKKNTTPATAPAPGTAVRALADLPVKGRAPKTGYARKQFGPAWSDDNTALWGHDGLSSRENILSRDLTGVSCKIGRSRPTKPPCSVTAGTLMDPYTGTVVQFIRGQQTSALVPIDHVVSLGDAWQKGAQSLSLSERVALANDPLNLVATTRTPNSAKNDSDAATWLIPRKSWRCAYVARQIAVKRRYRLWVTQAEKGAMKRVLSTCPLESLPGDGEASRRTE